MVVLVRVGSPFLIFYLSLLSQKQVLCLGGLFWELKAEGIGGDHFTWLFLGSSRVWKSLEVGGFQALWPEHAPESPAVRGRMMGPWRGRGGREGAQSHSLESIETTQVPDLVETCWGQELSPGCQKSKSPPTF